MKTICSTFLALTLFLTVSCSNDGNNAKATLTYWGQTGKITFAEGQDDAYERLVKESLTDLKVTGQNSVFQETASVDYSSMIAAYALCHVQARKDFKKTIDLLNLAMVKNSIYNAHKDSLQDLGYQTASALPLQPFDVDIYLVSSVASIQPIDTLSVAIR